MDLRQPLLSMDWNLLFTVITLLVLFVILKIFFFEKVHNFMVKREQDVKDTLQNAADTSQLADSKLADYEERIQNVEKEGRQIIKESRDEAKKQAELITDDANNRARQMIDHAQKEIEREEFNVRKQLREEIGEMAMLAAQEILEREISAKDHKDIVDKIIKEADEKPWN